jgi:hypothetical protein
MSSTDFSRCGFGFHASGKAHRPARPAGGLKSVLLKAGSIWSCLDTVEKLMSSMRSEEKAHAEDYE